MKRAIGPACRLRTCRTERSEAADGANIHLGGVSSVWQFADDEFDPKRFRVVRSIGGCKEGALRRNRGYFRFRERMGIQPWKICRSAYLGDLRK